MVRNVVSKFAGVVTFALVMGAAVLLKTAFVIDMLR